MAVIAKVAVQAATYAIDKAYDYLLPEEVGGQAGDGGRLQQIQAARIGIVQIGQGGDAQRPDLSDCPGRSYFSSNSLNGTLERTGRFGDSSVMAYPSP